METLKNMWVFFYNDTFKGWKTWEAALLLFFIACQLFVLYLEPDSLLGTITGITGIICVVFVSKGKLTNYFWGLIWAYCYFYSSWNNNFVGEMTSCLFIYIPAQYIGYFLWKQNMSQQTRETELVKTRKLTPLGWIVVASLSAVGTLAFVQYIKWQGGSSATLDGLSTVLTVVAQILMLMRYRDQWIIWILINIVSMFLWAETLALQIMYAVYLLNSVYGVYNWTMLEKQNAVNLNKA